MSDRKLYVGLDIRNDITQIAVLDPSRIEPDVLELGDEGAGIPTEVAIPGSGERIRDFMKKIHCQEAIYADGRESDPVNILAAFLRKTLSLTKKKYPRESIRGLVVTTEYRDFRLITTIYRALEKLGIYKDRAMVVDRRQSYIYYVLSQKRELWVNQVGMFDFGSDHLDYYQMDTDRSRRPAIVRVATKNYGDYAELFNGNEQSQEEKASIFEGMVQGAIHGHIITSLYMTGPGFADGFAEDVMKKLCVGRHLFIGDNLYVCGACYMAKEFGGAGTNKEFVYVSEDTISSNILIRAYADAKAQDVLLVRAGTVWYHIDYELDLIPDGDQELELCVQNVVTKERMMHMIPMEGIYGRTERKARVGIQIRFAGADRCIVTLRDKGFGEFFPSSYRIWEETITI